MILREPRPEQLAAIQRRGRFVLRACPGSGKTFTVARRIANRLSQWSQPHAGLAGLSFTNVACAEVEKSLSEVGLMGVNRYPHFLGTLDRFINTFIFLPFGHKVMGCSARPELVGFDERPWVHVGMWAWGERECNRKCNLTNFSWDLDGQLVDIRASPAKCSLKHRRCAELKGRFSKAGFATQTDAAYWGVQVLEKYPWIAKALVCRFPELIVDEAQDTSHAQMRIVDLLVKAGAKDVVLVGDPDQAIYEWRTAHPELLVEKMSAVEWQQPSLLTESRRSTQLICNATEPFSSLESPARGRSGGMKPILCFYDEDEPSALVKAFHSLCLGAGVSVSPETTVILVRGHALLRRVLRLPDEVDPWPDGETLAKLLARASLERDRKQMKLAWRLIEAAIVQLLAQTPAGHRVGVDAGRPAIDPGSVVRVLKALPASTLALRVWVPQARAIIEKWTRDAQVALAADALEAIRAKKYAMVNKERTTEFLDWPVRSFFGLGPQTLPVTVETIHAAKGKTYEAVMLVLSSRGKCTPKALSDEPGDPKEIRTAYVAMTRPRSVLVVAVPRGTKPGRLRRFTGFEVVPTLAEVSPDPPPLRPSSMALPSKGHD